MSTPLPGRPYLSPLVAGVGLGATLYATFLLTGHGLGAYGFFRDLTAGLAHVLAPFWTTENPYLPAFLHAKGPFSGWIAWEILGVALGALIGGLVSRRFRWRIEGGAGIAPPIRLLLALIGGVITGIGAALARGCTSGLGLSGGAVLSAGAFLFLAGFFLAGVLVSLWTRRLWQ